MADENITTQNPPVQTQEPIEEKTLKQLQAELTEAGFVGADALTTKKQVQTVLDNLAKAAENPPTIQANSEIADPEIGKAPIPDVVVDNRRLDEKVYSGKAKIMKEKLDAQPKVKFLIPLGVNEKRGAIETWQCNGYRLNILKGVLVDVPQQVAESLAESYQMTSKAGEEFLIDRPNDKPTKYRTIGEAL